MVIFQKVLKALSSVLPEGVRGKSFIEHEVAHLENRYIGNANIFPRDSPGTCMEQKEAKLSCSDTPLVKGRIIRLGSKVNQGKPGPTIFLTKRKLSNYLKTM